MTNNIKEKIKKDWNEFMQIEYPHEYVEGEPIPEKGVIEFVEQEIQECSKKIFDDIDKMLMDNKMIYIDSRYEGYKQLKKKHGVK